MIATVSLRSRDSREAVPAWSFHRRSFHSPRRHRRRVRGYSSYEHALMERLIAGLAENSGYKNLRHHRSGALSPNAGPTLALRRDQSDSGANSAGIASKLGDQGFFTWDGNYYCAEPYRAARRGKVRRVPAHRLVHYNTVGEVDRLLAALRQIVGL